MLGDLAWWVTLVILIREIGVTLLRFAVIRYGVISASPGGKAKTFVQIIAIGLYILPLPASFDWIEVSRHDAGGGADRRHRDRLCGTRLGGVLPGQEPGQAGSPPAAGTG